MLTEHGCWTLCSVQTSGWCPVLPFGATKWYEVEMLGCWAVGRLFFGNSWSLKFNLGSDETAGMLGSICCAISSVLLPSAFPTSNPQERIRHSQPSAFPTPTRQHAAVCFASRSTLGSLTMPVVVAHVRFHPSVSTHKTTDVGWTNESP